MLSATGARLALRRVKEGWCQAVMGLVRTGSAGAMQARKVVAIIIMEATMGDEECAAWCGPVKGAG